jgi:hypothetical protein
MSGTLGMIGPRRCDQSLTQILNGYSDKMLTKRVMSIYQELTFGCHILEQIEDVKYRRRFMTLLKNHLCERVKNEHDFPWEVESHLLCCLSAYYRDKLRDLDLIKSKRYGKEDSNVEYVG